MSQNATVVQNVALCDKNEAHKQATKGSSFAKVHFVTDCREVVAPESESCHCLNAMIKRKTATRPCNFPIEALVEMQEMLLIVGLMVLFR